MADSIVRLKVDSSEYDNKIKRAAQGLQQLGTSLHHAGKSFVDADKDQIEFVKQLGKMETVTKTAKGSLGEMTQSFTNLRMQYKQMTDAEKQSPFGKALNQSLTELKGRIKDTQRDLQEINQELNTGKFGQFGGILDGIGQKMGITTNLTELLTSQTALLTAGIGASVAIVGKATQAWAAYNSELSRQDQITSVTTGLSGGSANTMTDTMRALADTYNVNFREAINAANTLMSQFGETGDSAIQLIKDGMQGMILGDGGKLLSMIQQFAPAFQSAGVSASQLIAVIHNSEGGIFTDQNMQAIVMGIKNIRLMTKQTSEALAKLGIDGEEMSRKMSDGSLTVFEALKQVAGQLKNVDSNSKEAGEVMQTVFGRQGSMAGTNIAKAIDQLNTNLDETKKQTGELGDAFADLQTANEQLNKAMREAFGYDGWEQMATGIKSKLVTALADVITNLNAIKQSMASFLTGGTWSDILKPFSAKDAINQQLQQQVLQQANNLKKRMAGLLTFGGGGTSGGDPKPTRPTGGGGNMPVVYAADSIAYQEQLVSELTKKWKEAGAAVRDDYAKQLGEAKQTLSEMQGGFSTEKVGQIMDLTGRTPMADLTQGAELTLPVKLEIQSPVEQWKDQIASLQEAISTAWSTEAITAYQDEIDALQKKIDKFTGKTDGGNMAKDWQSAANAIGQVGSAMQQIEDPAAKVMGIIAQAIATIALTFAKSMEGTFTPWDWIAGAAAGTATMISTISAIKSATAGSYAEGGIIPGTHYSGDTQWAQVNAGELILNRSQQGNLASQLEGGAADGGYAPSHISGEQIYVVLNRYTRRTGKGELVTWRN